MFKFSTKLTSASKKFRALWRASLKNSQFPIDSASLVVFRVFFGAMMVIEVIRYFAYGWIGRFFVDPVINFTFPGFHWVTPLPEFWMYALFVLMGIAAVLMTIGRFYRPAAVFFFLSFTYVFLLEATLYLNHHYFIALLAFLMIFFPLAEARSWHLWIFRFMIGVPYFFGGVAKLNADWLIRNEPMREWLSEAGIRTHEWIVDVFTYGGAVFDLAIVPLLLYKRTRVYAFAVSILFNVSNHFLFEIGIFPWFMLGASLLFFEPEWPRRWVKGLKTTVQRNRLDTLLTKHASWTLALLSIFVFIQIALPFRHLFYEGNVHWTERGSRWSWHMRLNEKRGSAEYFVFDPETRDAWIIAPEDYVADFQVGHTIGHPEVILQFAHFLANDFAERGHPSVEVHVKSEVSLNGRPLQPMTDPKQNLAKASRVNVVQLKK